MGSIWRSVAKTAPIFSRKGYQNALAIPSLYVTSGGGRYYRHTQPGILGIMPAAAMLLSFGTTHFNSSSTECTPNAAYDTKLLCQKASYALLMFPTITVKQAMTLAQFNEEDMKQDRYRRSISRSANKLRKAQVGKAGLPILPPSITAPTVPPIPPSITLPTNSSLSTSSLSALTEDKELDIKMNSSSRSPTASALSSTASSAIDLSVSININTININGTNQQKKRRRSCKQLLIDKSARVFELNRETEAFTIAVTRWAEQSKLPKYSRVPAQKIVNEVNEKYKTNVKGRLVRRYVSEGRIGSVPRWGRGRKSTIPQNIITALDSAVITYIQLTNAEMKQQPARPIIIKKLEACVKEGGHTVQGDGMYNRMMDRHADKIEVNDQNSVVEQRRLEWTTWANLNVWFETLKDFFVDKGFARHKTKEDGDIEGELVFLEFQTDRILNLDESEVSTDGTTKLSGGRPTTKLSTVDTSLPKGASTGNKSGYSATFIGGSTVAGWPLPCHIQAKSSALAENQKLNIDWFKNTRDVLGVYGCGGDVVQKGISVGLNPKAGMDTEEFEKYLTNRIMPLYPDAKDERGKRVAVIVDSGPGRLNTILLAKMRIKGFYLIPGVPNTTHVTQATDRNYGWFKSIYRTNLTKLTAHRAGNKEKNSEAKQRDEVPPNKKETIQPTDIPLLIFGGTVIDEEGVDSEGVDDNGIDIGLENAFGKAFGFERNRKIWAEIGINPFNRKCLEDSKVKHEVLELPDGTLDVDADPLTSKLLQIERLNRAAVSFLVANGYDGTVFSKCAPRQHRSQRNIAVTAPRSRERQDRLAKASTASGRFVTTGGEHLNSDDWFITTERTSRVAMVKDLEAKKKAYEEAKKREDNAKAIIEKYRSKDKDITNPTHAEQLTATELKTLYKWKHGKNVPQKDSQKPKVLADWLATKDRPPHDAGLHSWTTENENDLVRMKSDDIRLEDTEVGRQMQISIDDMVAKFPHASPEQIQQMKDALSFIQPSSPTSTS